LALAWALHLVWFMLTTRAAAAEELTRVKKRLGEIEEAVKDGWDKVTDQVKAKLNDWLDKN